MHKAQKQVQDFHRDVIKAPSSPAAPKFRNAELRAKLILEEALETVVALLGTKEAQYFVEDVEHEVLYCRGDDEKKPDLIETIDGLCDTIVVCYGTAEDMGIDLEPFYDEVMRSNMAKVGGPIRADGKHLKPPGWTPPDLQKVLADELERREIYAHVPEKNLNTVTPEEWRAWRPVERRAFLDYWWAQNHISLLCLGCGFPVAFGCAACDACREHPEILISTFLKEQP